MSARGSRYLVPAEVTLVVLSLATTYGFSRVFSSMDFFAPLVVVMLYTHAITVIARRRGLGVALAALVAIPGLLLLLTYLFFIESTTLLLPTGRTLDAARDAMAASWTTFQNVVAPAPVEPGFLLASAAALFFAIFLADWAAFRLWSPFEAVVPLATLFVFCSLLGSTIHRIDSSAAFLGAVLAFLLVHRVARSESGAGWLTTDVDRGSNSILRGGAVLAAAALALGIAVGPRLPGASSPALISWRGGETGAGSRVTISPLVDIRDRLVQQSDTEVFTVESNEPAYWRMTALDTFEGDIWRSGGKYAAAEGDLPGTVPSGVPTRPLEQRFTIRNLSVLWVPAAYEPRFIESPDAPVRYQSESATLIVDTEVSSSDAMSYRVRSAVPQPTAETLRAASTEIPADIRGRYLQLPADLDPAVRSEAQRVTRDAPTPYDKARALQDWFVLSGEFRYSTEVPQGHGESAIASFLQNKVGYCEQFAGTYAAMARSIGLPARVAVGFTPGEPDPVRENVFRVRGKQAHAWPEVYLGPQFGWVYFEPTPGRGAPNTEQWTGRPAQQDTSAPATTSTTTTAPAPSGSTPDAPQSSVPPSTIGPDVATGPQASGPAGESPGWSWRLLLGIGVVGSVVLLVAYAALVSWLKALRRSRRRHAASDPSARVRVAWEESVEELALVGAVYDRAETHAEFADRAGAALDEAAPLLVDLARDTDAAVFAPDLLTDDVASRALAASETITETVRDRVSPTKQWRRQLDPRPLLPHLRPSTRRRAETTRR